MTASVLGANIYSDIFFIAFKLPNLFRRIFAEGAFTQVFIPAFAKSSRKGVFSANIFVNTGNDRLKKQEGITPNITKEIR